MINRIVNDIAYKNDISIINYKFNNEVKACSVENDDKYYIGIDEKQFDTEAERNTAKIHELGHCMTGALYCEASPLFTQEKCEYKANKWAIRRFVPKAELLNYLKQNYQMYEIAALMGLTEEFLWQAYYYYFR